MEKRMDYYRDKVFRFIVQFVKNEDLASDLTQDVMVKIWDKRSRIATLSDIDNYVLKIAKHHIIDHFKKLAREKEYQEEIWYLMQKSVNRVESPIIQKEINSQLDAVLKQLPPRQQEVFTLNKRNGLSLEEIAVTLNLETRTVRNHLNRAMKVIRSQMNIDSFLTLLMVIGMGVGL